MVWSMVGNGRMGEYIRHSRATLSSIRAAKIQSVLPCYYIMGVWRVVYCCQMTMSVTYRIYRYRCGLAWYIGTYWSRFNCLQNKNIRNYGSNNTMINRFQHPITFKSHMHARMITPDLLECRMSGLLADKFSIFSHHKTAGSRHLRYQSAVIFFFP